MDPLKKVTFQPKISPEKGKRYSLRNLVFLQDIRQWTKSINSVILSALHRSQSHLERVNNDNFPDQ
jgi:hypothetical protein